MSIEETKKRIIFKRFGQYPDPFEDLKKLSKEDFIGFLSYILKTEAIEDIAKEIVKLSPFF